jgi:drug/metabolite transporter superfamily protein YnfA
VAEAAKRNPQLAGLVLALLGLVTYGATSPFGLVLSAEWLADPARPRTLRRWDWLGAGLALPGTAYFVLLSVQLRAYAPGGTSVTPMIVGYWAGFAVWLWVRSRTRWRGLREARKRGTR